LSIHHNLLTISKAADKGYQPYLKAIWTEEEQQKGSQQSNSQGTATEEEVEELHEMEQNDDGTTMHSGDERSAAHTIDDKEAMASRCARKRSRL